MKQSMDDLIGTPKKDRIMWCQRCEKETSDQGLLKRGSCSICGWDKGYAGLPPEGCKV